MAAMLGWLSEARSLASLKPCQPLGILDELLRQDLDGHFATQLGVLRTVDLPHATLADFLRLLGYSRIDTTADIYVHVDQKAAEEALETVAEAIIPSCLLGGCAATKRSERR